MEIKEIEKKREEEIVNATQRMRIILKNGTHSNYLRPLTKFEILKKPLTLFSKPTDIEDKVNYSCLKQIAELEVEHKVELHGFFTPFISEIIESIPKDVLEIAYAFEISIDPIKYPNQKYYRSKIIVYKKI